MGRYATFSSLAREQVCPRCGELVPFGEEVCPACEARARKAAGIPYVVAALVAITLALFVVTHFMVRGFERQQDRLAQDWYQRGESDYRAGNVLQAIDDYRSALSYSHDNPQYRLRLAEALESAGRLREAQAYLLALWDRMPGDGTINLELGRLSARLDDETGALRFYHGAIFGVWNDDPEQQRRQTRMELIQFLLQRKRQRLADAELIQLSVDLPKDPGFVNRVGDLFLQVGDSQRALATFQGVLQTDAHNAAALAGAGQSSFLLARYADAEKLLQRAAARSPQDEKVAALLRQARFIVENSPFQPRLSLTERAQRAQRLLSLAAERMQSCAQQKLIDLTAVPPQNDLQSDALQLHEVMPTLKPKAVRANSDVLDVAYDLLAKVENDTSNLCGPATGDDQTIALILAQRERP